MRALSATHVWGGRICCCYSQAITVPWFKLLELPLRRINVTVPLVVGVHCKFNGVPADAARPSAGILKGFGFAAKAARGALRSARTVVKRKYIMRDVGW